MRDRARALVAAGSLLAGGLMAGCGGGGGLDDGATGAPSPGAGAAPAVRIDRPADGQALSARPGAGGLRRVRVTVAGRAGAGRTVFLRATCDPRPCTARTRAGAGGRWRVALSLTVGRAARFVTIDAGLGAPGAAGGVAVVTVEVGGGRRGSDPRSPAGSRRPSAARRIPPAAPTLPHEVALIGDSLAVGMEEALRAALPGWRVRVDARTGRALPEGMRILGELSDAPAILAFSLFTNDDPRATEALEEAVRATASRPGGCAVWATIQAPPVRGADYAAANRLLARLAGDQELAGGLRIVDWRAAVDADPPLLAGDGVHGTPAGYRARAELYARAIRACAGKGSG